MNLLVDLDEIQTGVAHRPARLYSFDPVKYKKFNDEGMHFELKVPKQKKKRKAEVN